MNNNKNNENRTTQNKQHRYTQVNTDIPVFIELHICFITKGKCVKGKAIPLQAWTGPEGSRRLRLPDFTTIGT
jgi:hypothetical protein